ncbi:MAG: Crp/Fnr family transcriptional regulator [Bacteroidota bacterium]
MLYERLIDYFSDLTQLSIEEKNAIIESMEIIACAEGEHLKHANQKREQTFFILSGFVRQYEYVDGEAITTNFYNAGQWIIAPTSFSGKAISTVNLICTEDTAVVVGNEEKAQRLFHRFPRFERIARMIVEHEFSKHEAWMRTYMTATPTERYLQLLEKAPTIFQKVQQYHIASFIGVKPETLSRIRKKFSSGS